jgi:mRNA-degrading endonuclease RelE of RelBE toxin-antitoxin system
VAKVIVTPAAADDLAALIRTHSLPDDTRERVKRSLRGVERFPRFGAPLEGKWAGFRFILGPWRWLVIVYAYDESTDEVFVVTMQDARSSPSATSAR